MVLVKFLDIRVNQIIPVPILGCDIDVRALAEISKPTHYWTIRDYTAPRVLIASSERARNIPDFAESLDVGRNLEMLKLRIWHKSNPSQDYGVVEVTPLYNDLTKQ